MATKTKTKMDVARDLYAKHIKSKSRAEIVKLFQDKADLTPAGANTYEFRVYPNR